MLTTQASILKFKQTEDDKVEGIEDVKKVKDIRAEEPLMGLTTRILGLADWAKTINRHLRRRYNR